MCVFYTHMIGVKFHHIKIGEVRLLGVENWSTVQNVQNGSYDADPASRRWLTKTDLSSDDTRAVGFQLGAGELSWGRPLGLCTNRKGVAFLSSWHLRCYLSVHLKQKTKTKRSENKQIPRCSLHPRIQWWRGFTLCSCEHYVAERPWHLVLGHKENKSPSEFWRVESDPWS